MQLQRAPVIRLQTVLLSFCSLLFLSDAKMVSIDWALNSQLFDNGVHTKTIFVRLNDLLKFRCPAGVSLQIHLTNNALNALECRFGPKAIGYCSPETTDPRIVIRKFSPMPDQPLFLEGESYYFTAATNDTSGQLNDGLCRKTGMRLRIFVLPRDAVGHEQSITDLTRALWLREQIKETPEVKPEVVPSTTAATPRRIHHKQLHHADKSFKQRDAPRQQLDMRYDISEPQKPQPPYNDVTEFSNLPNPLANHLPHLDFEIGYEESSSSFVNRISPVLFSLYILLRIL